MNLATVMDEIAARLATLPGLRVFAYPPGDVSPPAAIVSYPDRIKFDQTFGRGMDRMTGVPIVVLVGKATDRTARDRIGAYANGAGATSIRALLGAAGWVSCADVAVVECEFDVHTIGAVDFLAAIFTCDITGKGSS